MKNASKGYKPPRRGDAPLSRYARKQATPLPRSVRVKVQCQQCEMVRDGKLLKCKRCGHSVPLYPEIV